MADPVALRKESVDRNANFDGFFWWVEGSLSARRAWIEMLVYLALIRYLMSLSARRAWIEIFSVHEVFANFDGSLSARRAWIEIV